MQQRQPAFCIFVALLVLLPMAAATAARDPVATVQRVSGTLSVRRQGVTAFAPLAARGAVYVGDLVGTGPNSRASLLFADGSQLRLSGDSAIEILAPAAVGRGHEGLFRALTGEVWTRLRPGKAVQTRSAIAGVRGTEFHLRVSEDGTTVLTVLDGTVEFYNEFGAVEVGEAQQSTARPGSAPTAPVTLDNPGLIIEWTVDLGFALVAREQSFVSADPREIAAQVPQRRQRAQAEPANADARREYGDALHDAGKMPEALVEYQESTRLAPNRPEMLSRSGDALLALGRLDEARAAYGRALALDGQHAPAIAGLAWEALLRGRPADAETRARTAGADAEAQLVLGLALMRQPEKVAEAQRTMEAAAGAGPAPVRAQARSWLALMLLAQDDTAGAIKEAEAAAESAPHSAVARANLALVCFYADRPVDAEREARAALNLNPDSVPALCALGQAQLARGDVDRAARTAARAVGLDPAQAQAHYLLGIADAQRRDYRHAVRALEECRRLAPDFLPAAGALARVYTKMGQNDKAVAVLEALLPVHRSADQVLIALGGVYYQQGKYGEAEESYREALKLRPNSALACAELALAFIDAIRLDEAIEAGQRAVHLAPQVGQYHAILGLAYDHGRLATQAEREFREAVALDPHNALAHLALGLRTAQSDLKQRLQMSGQGLGLGELLTLALQSVGSSPAGGAITQACLQDPSVPRQFLRGGTSGEATLGGGASNPESLSVRYDALGAAGNLNSLSLGTRGRDDGWRDNTDATITSLSETAGFAVAPRTTLLFRGAHNWREYGVFNLAFPDDYEDRADSRENLLQLSARHRFGSRSTLWLGLSRPEQRLALTDPLANSSSMWFYLEHQDQLWPEPTWTQVVKSDVLVPEARLELSLGGSPRRPAILTLGGTHVDLHPVQAADLVPPDPDLQHFAAETHLPGNMDVVYAQFSQRASERLSFAAQVRYQGLNTHVLIPTLSGQLITHPMYRARRGEFVLPSLVANYQAGRRTGVRLLYSRQAQGAQLAPVAFAPLDAALSTEPAVLLRGSPARTNTIEVDVAHSFSPWSWLKVFGFQSSAESTRDPYVRVHLKDVSRSGVGVRWEQRLASHLYGNTTFVWNRTTNDTPYAPFQDSVAPYSPQHLAELGLNYLDGTGTRLGLQMMHTGRFYRDTGIYSQRERPTFPARLYVDLTLAREASLNSEYFLKASNLFNTPTLFNDFPAGERRVTAGVTLRY